LARRYRTAHVLLLGPSSEKRYCEVGCDMKPELSLLPGQGLGYLLLIATVGWVACQSDNAGTGAEGGRGGSAATSSGGNGGSETGQGGSSPVTGAGGTVVGMGGTAQGTGGTATGTGGTPSPASGSQGTGGASTGAGGTTPGAGGTETSTGGTTSGAGGSPGTGGTVMSTGGGAGMGGMMMGADGGMGMGGMMMNAGGRMGMGGMMMNAGGRMGMGGMMMGAGGRMGMGGAMNADAGSAACHAGGTLQVTNSGMTAYVIDGASNPTLTFCRNTTYVFAVMAAGHPFYIKTVKSTGTGNAYSSGVSGNGAEMGDVTFAVPSDAPDTLFYDCSLHAAMAGTIHIVN
jgi:hypothetical protein